MAITNFIPEIWSASILENLRNELTYTGLTNRNYEGEIAQAGDTVRITSFDDPQVRPYTRNADTAANVPGNNPGAAIPGIQWDLLADSQQVFQVNQADYFAFKVDDIDKRQALSGFVSETTQGAAYNLAAKTDQYVANLMVNGAPTIGAGGLVTDPGVAYEILVDLRTALTKTNTPRSGRWVVVPPEFYALLLKDPRFVDASASGTTETLRNGQVGRAAGFDVIESNVVPHAVGADTLPDTEDDVYSIIAGHAGATTFAQQILSTEAMRLENAFADGVRGLHVYDGKVLEGREGWLAKTGVTFGPVA